MSALAAAWASKAADLELALREHARGRAYGPGDARGRDDLVRVDRRQGFAFAYRQLIAEAPSDDARERYGARIAELEDGDLFAP